ASDPILRTHAKFLVRFIHDDMDGSMKKCYDILITRCLLVRFHRNAACPKSLPCNVCKPYCRLEFRELAERTAGWNLYLQSQYHIYLTQAKVSRKGPQLFSLHS